MKSEKAENANTWAHVRVERPVVILYLVVINTDNTAVSKISGRSQ